MDLAASKIQRSWRHKRQEIIWAKFGIINGINLKTSLECKKTLNTIEKIWGKRMLGHSTNQWTTSLGETLVRNALLNSGNDTWKPKKINHYLPDLETRDFIYEVKTRNWTTSGTAGEKVFGVPYKYSDIPRLYGKPLIIVCVAFQEYELTFGNSNVFGDVSFEKTALLDIYASMGIKFMKFSDLHR